MFLGQDEYREAVFKCVAAMLAAGRWYYDKEDRVERTVAKAIEYVDEVNRQLRDK